MIFGVRVKILNDKVRPPVNQMYFYSDPKLSGKRAIRSYVLRQGRLTKAQARAIDRYWIEFGIDYRNELLDLYAVFNRDAPKILDIGTGMGETALKSAREIRKMTTSPLKYIDPASAICCTGSQNTDLRISGSSTTMLSMSSITRCLNSACHPFISISRIRGPRNATTSVVL